MTASEFAFLALGLVLGVASGAALIEVLRARPPISREIRVTVSPNAIHARRASTLADPEGVGDPVGPARGGPGDRRWHEDELAPAAPIETGRRVDDDRSMALEEGAGSATSVLPGASGTFVRSPLSQPDPSTQGLGAPVPAVAGGSAEGSAAVATAGSRPAPLWLRPAAASAGGFVAIPMSIEPDPLNAAFRSTAFATPAHAPAAQGERRDGDERGTGSVAGGAGSVTVAAAGGAESAAGVVVAAAGGAESAAGGAEPGGPQTDVAAGAAGPASAPGGDPAADGPCADERRVAEERCAVATRAREGAATAAEALRRAQRTYDELATRAEASAATADPRSVRTAKEQAQQRFRDARTGAQTRDDVEAGARAWLAEINRINHDTREAALASERDRVAVTALAPTVERLAVEADAARIAAERADEACLAAREAVAACDEARTLADAAARSGGTSEDDSGAGRLGREGAGWIAAATPEPEDEFAFSTPMNSSSGEDAVILRILRGDRDAMQRAVARLSGDDPEAHRRWQALLGGLAEALIARSIEAAAFDFPTDHPFWGPFTQSQNRDIAAALSSMGFRFDGFGDWVDDRIPSQRDLSLAVGYAGLDPMRVRRWPNEAETRDLLREVRVAADEYIAGAAGGLSLGELVTLLGRRADGLTDLWNQWGSVRPILLEAN